ncbi:MAG: hypothetical protein FWG99_07660 [Treponema sp.]|nr:hypothetical protein [Treponema sp.]
MKKLSFICFVLWAVTICGCVTHPAIVWNESLPDEEMVTIYWITAGVNPVSYNGINIDWNLKKTGWNPIKIPEGVVTFELKGKQYDSGPGYRYVYNWDGISFSFNFEKGREYTVSPLYATINVYDGKSNGMGKKNLIEAIRPEWERK